MEDGKIKTEEERMQEIEAVEANVKCMKDFTSPEQLYEELIRSIRKYNTSYYREREDYFARNNYRIMRYADVLLSYAECLVETGTSASDAAVYVDKVRERAGLSKLKDSRWKDCLSSKEVFIKRLQMERALELCFEGFRFWDLRRWKSNLTETAKGMNISGTRYTPMEVDKRSFSEYMYYGPIPYSEVLKYDELKQIQGL